MTVIGLGRRTAAGGSGGGLYELCAATGRGNTSVPALCGVCFLAAPRPPGSPHHRTHKGVKQRLSVKGTDIHSPARGGAPRVATPGLAGRPWTKLFGPCWDCRWSPLLAGERFLTAGRHKGGLLLLTVKTVMPTAGVALPSGGVGGASVGVRRPRADRVPSSAGIIRPSLDESAPPEEVTLLPARTLWPR